MPMPALLENVPEVIRSIGYTDWQTFLIEFGIVVMLFFTAIKQALAVGSSARESASRHTGFTQNLFGSSQYKQTNNILALVLGFGAAYLLFFRYKITLGTIAENGLMTGLFAIAAGLTAYSFSAARVGPNNRFWAFAIGTIAGLLVYSFLALKIGTLGGAFSGMIPLIMFALVFAAFATYGQTAVAGAAGTGPPLGINLGGGNGRHVPAPAGGAPPAQPVPPGLPGTPVAARNVRNDLERLASVLGRGARGLGRGLVVPVRALRDRRRRARQASQDLDRACENFDRIVVQARTPEMQVEAAEAWTAAAGQVQANFADLAEQIQEEIDAATLMQQGCQDALAFSTPLAEQERQLLDNIASWERIIAEAETAPMIVTVPPAPTPAPAGPAGAPTPPAPEPVVLPPSPAVVAKLEEIKDAAAAVSSAVTAEVKHDKENAATFSATVKADIGQIERWKEAVKVIIDEMKAVEDALKKELGNKPPTIGKLRDYVVQLGRLNDNYITASESYIVDADLENISVLCDARYKEVERLQTETLQTAEKVEEEEKKLKALEAARLAEAKKIADEAEFARRVAESEARAAAPPSPGPGFQILAQRILAGEDQRTVLADLDPRWHSEVLRIVEGLRKSAPPAAPALPAGVSKSDLINGTRIIMEKIPLFKDEINDLRMKYTGTLTENKVKELHEFASAANEFLEEIKSEYPKISGIKMIPEITALVESLNALLNIDVPLKNVEKFTRERFSLPKTKKALIEFEDKYEGIPDVCDAIVANAQAVLAIFAR